MVLSLPFAMDGMSLIHSHAPLSSMGKYMYKHHALLPDACHAVPQVPGVSVYGEKRVSVEGPGEGEKIEYRVWNPFRSKLAAAILAGLDHIYIKPGSKLLYLGAASGTVMATACWMRPRLCCMSYCNGAMHSDMRAAAPE